MPEPYLYRAIIILPIANQAQGNGLASQFDPGGGGAETFNTIRLSLDGQEPASHVACDTRMQQSILDMLPAYSGIADVGYEVETGLIMRKGDAGWSSYGCVGWDFEDALRDAGLKLIQ